VLVVERGAEVDLVVPIQPLMILEPMLFTIKLRNDKMVPTYHVSTVSETEYKALQQLFNIRGDYEILLGE